PTTPPPIPLHDPLPICAPPKVIQSPLPFLVWARSCVLMVFGAAVCAEILPGNINAPATSANRSGRIDTPIDRYPALSLLGAVRSDRKSTRLNSSHQIIS